MTSADLDLDPEGLRGVVHELVAFQAAIQQLVGYLQDDPLTAAHFGAPDRAGQLGLRCGAAGQDLIAALARGGHGARVLADELAAGLAVLVAADQRGEQELRAAGEGMG